MNTVARFVRLEIYFDPILSRVLLRCERVCIRVSRKRREHAVPLSTLLVIVTNKLKEFIIHALLLARIEHVHISRRTIKLILNVDYCYGFVCVCISVCVCMRVGG